MPTKSKLKRATGRGAFIVPYENSMDHKESQAQGWSIWKFTDLDWSISAGLPAGVGVYQCSELEEGQRLLAECWNGTLTNF